MNVKPGHFYTKFYDETVEEAVANHSVGYKSIEEAIDDSNAIEFPNKAYSVLNDKLEVVWSGTTKSLDHTPISATLKRDKMAEFEKETIEGLLNLSDARLVLHISTLIGSSYTAMIMNERRIAQRVSDIMKANPTIKQEISDFHKHIEEKIRESYVKPADN